MSNVNREMKDWPGYNGFPFRIRTCLAYTTKAQIGISDSGIEKTLDTDKESMYPFYETSSKPFFASFAPLREPEESHDSGK